ncbi:MAG: hypothetical protein ACFE0J_25360 [Elainellaceae cyanobacterium]
MIDNTHMRTKHLISSGAIASLVLVTGIACTSQPSDSGDAVSPESSTEQPATETPDSATETSELSSETSEPQSTLLTYNGPETNVPVTAQYPDTMEVSSSGSGEGVGVFFTFKPQGNALDDAEVHVFLPSGASSTSDLMPMITGANGLIENNGWTLDGSRADTASEFPYPWFEMVFDISTDFEQSGHILIGQTNGQAVQVTLLYPSEMADAYWPAAETVLDSLEFDASLLPLDNSSEVPSG